MGAGAFAAHQRHVRREGNAGGDSVESTGGATPRSGPAGAGEASSGSAFPGPHLSNYPDAQDAYLASTRGVALATFDGAHLRRQGSGQGLGQAGQVGGGVSGSGAAGAATYAVPPLAAPAPLHLSAGLRAAGLAGTLPGSPGRAAPTVSVDVGGGLLEDLDPSVAAASSSIGAAKGGAHASLPPPTGAGPGPSPLGLGLGLGLGMLSHAGGAAGASVASSSSAASVPVTSSGLLPVPVSSSTTPGSLPFSRPPPPPPPSSGSGSLLLSSSSSSPPPPSSSARASRLSPPTPFGLRQVGPEATCPPLAAALALWARQTPTAKRLTLVSLGLFLCTLQLASRAPASAAKSLIVSFGSLWAPLSMAWMWSCLVAHWEAGRVSYDVCFSPSDARHLPSARELGTMVAGLTLPAALFGALYALVAGREVAMLQAALGPGAAALWTPATRVPGLFAFCAHATTIALVLLPKPLPRPDARRLFVRTVGHVFAAGWRMVSWSDFLLADITTSLSRPAAEFARVSCLALGGARSPLEAAAGATCGDPGPLPALLQALPYALRLVQCVRVFCDTRQQPNLWNALKYTTALPSAAAAYGFGAAMFRHTAATKAMHAALAAIAAADPGPGAASAAAIAAAAEARAALDVASAALAVAQRRAFLAALVNSLYSFFWDVERDWGIGLFTAGKIGTGAKGLVQRLARALRGGPEGSGPVPVPNLAITGGLSPSPSEAAGLGNGARSASSPALPQAALGALGPGHRQQPPAAPSAPVLELPRAISYSPRFYATLVVSNLFLRHAWMLKFSATARASLLVMAFVPILEAYRRYQWAFVRIEAELRKIQVAKPEIGRLVPPVTVQIKTPDREQGLGNARDSDDERAPPPRQQSHSA